MKTLKALLSGSGPFYLAAFFWLIKGSIVASHLFTWRTDAQMLAHQFTNAEIVGEIWIAAYFLIGLAFMILAKLENIEN